MDMAARAKKLPVPFLDRLSTKITLTAIVFLFVLSTAVAFQVESGFRRNQYGAYSSSQGVLAEQIKNEYLQTTIQRARQLEMYLQNAGRITQNAAQFIEVQLDHDSNGQLNRDLVAAFFNELREQNLDVSGLYFIRVDGNILTDGDAVPLAADTGWLSNTHQTYLKTANLSSQPIAWQLPQPAETGPKKIMVQVPVYSKGQYQGFVVATLPVAHLSEH
jgi:hypothetical protein